MRGLVVGGKKIDRAKAFRERIGAVQALADALGAMDPLDVDCSPSRFTPDVTPEKLHRAYQQAIRWLH